MFSDRYNQIRIDRTIADICSVNMKREQLDVRIYHAWISATLL